MAFFEQLGKKITDAGQNVAQQTRNFADVTQLNNEIAEKEKKIRELFTSIGQSYYENHKNDADAEEKNKIEVITALYEGIIESNEKIKQIKGIVKCQSCGADIPYDAAFCNVCGTKVQELNEDRTEQKICPACNKPVPKENLFCNYCGAKIEEA